LEDDGCAHRARLLVYEVGCDDALRLQTEAVAIEDERAFEVVDGEGDDIETLLHRSAFSFAGSTMRIHATVKKGSEAVQSLWNKSNSVRSRERRGKASKSPRNARASQPLSI